MMMTAHVYYGLTCTVLPVLSVFHDISQHNVLHCRPTTGVHCQHALGQCRQLIAVLADGNGPHLPTPEYISAQIRANAS